MAILKSIKKDTKTVSFRLPAEVVADYEVARNSAKDAGFALDLTDQVERLIAASVKQAMAELDEVKAAQQTASA